MRKCSSVGAALASPLQGQVLGAINLTHASGAELFENPVVAEDLADHGSLSEPGLEGRCDKFR
ncbi:MAG: hypothetical protein P8Y44_14245 [Acidobacteriota bacterium]